MKNDQAMESQLSKEMSRRARTPKAGDWSGLFNIVNKSCGKKIKATLTGLDEELMADVYAKFVQKIAQMYCVIDDEAAAKQVRVQIAGNK